MDGANDLSTHEDPTSTITFAVGVVALGCGAALYFTAPKPTAPGVAVGGRW
jgi:hypothetical protein